MVPQIEWQEEKLHSLLIVFQCKTINESQRKDIDNDEQKKYSCPIFDFCFNKFLIKTRANFWSNVKFSKLYF